MNQFLSQELQALGLGDYESRVLAVLLEESPSSAANVAKRLDLSRSSVYTTLSGLISKGLVGTTYKNDVKQFEAQGYDGLEQFVQAERRQAAERAEALRGLRDTIDGLGKSDGLVPKAVFFEGQEGLKRSYLEMLRKAPDGAVMKLLRDEFVWSPAWAFVFGDEWKERVARIKKEKNLGTQLLVNGSEAERGRAGYYAERKNTETRFLKEGSRVSSFAQYCLGDTQIILSLREGDLSGIQITNRNLAANQAVIFDALWAGAELIS